MRPFILFSYYPQCYVNLFTSDLSISKRSAVITGGRPFGFLGVARALDFYYWEITFAPNLNLSASAFYYFTLAYPSASLY